MQPIESEISVKVFISYAHADQELRKKLEDHLSSLKYSGEITVWQDQEIPAGANWEDQINTHIEEADLILLLVSASFIASKYCWNKEVQASVKRHKAGKARVIPIVLKPVHWQNTPIGQLQALPTGAKPVTQWSDQDTAFEDVVRGIQDVVGDLLPKLQEEVQRKEKIEVLKNKLSSEINPALANIAQMLYSIETKFSKQAERKKELEAELEGINMSMDDLRLKYDIFEVKESLLEKQRTQIMEQLRILGYGERAVILHRLPFYRRMESIRKQGFLTIDAQPFQANGPIWQMPYDRYNTIPDFLDEIYFTLIGAKPAPPPYTFGTVWILRDIVSGRVFKDMGRSWAEERKKKLDDRKLREVGIEPGMILEIISPPEELAVYKAPDEDW